MKKHYLLGIAALSAVVLLAGCGTKTPAEFCEQNGGVFEEDLCLFEDGSYCEAEAFSKGECAMGENIETVADETTFAEYCVENGGELRVEDGASLCMFADGSYCETESYFYGECQEGDIFYNTIDENDVVIEEIVTDEENAEETTEETTEEPTEEVVEAE